MRNKIAKVASIVMVLVLALTLMVGCRGQGTPTETLTIYHAGSLTVPFDDLATEFESAHPNVDVLCESGGSAKMMNKAITVEEAGETPPDIIASADYTLIPDRLYEKGYADWNIVFARNTMVLCYRSNAPGSAAIVSGTRTWYDVLRNDSVSYGHSNPDEDPCGYRTPMVIQLAQKYYYDEAADFGLTPDSNADRLYNALIPGSEHERGRVGGTSETRPGGSKEVVSKKSVDLIVSIQSGDLDYAFEYRSVAVQHKLNFIELDDAINLSQTGKMGNATYEDFYKKASIEIIKEPGPPPTYKTNKGKPIVYGITIPLNARNKELAMEFIQLLLSDTGKNIMEVKNGQPFIVPALTDDVNKLPDGLKSFVK
ncbi:MAG: tungstate ABC transporter substrate-binding protein WtpA [Chloroflexota bacterium]|nr:tungstate ABC transporter substrate-binding protein WtpA [Chloroflexota bacterium]